MRCEEIVKFHNCEEFQLIEEKLKELFSVNCLVLLCLLSSSFVSLTAIRSSTVVSFRLQVSLGLPVTFMKKCCDQVFQTAELLSQTRVKLQNVTDLTSEELREV